MNDFKTVAEIDKEKFYNLSLAALKVTKKLIAHQVIFCINFSLNYIKKKTNNDRYTSRYNYI